MKNALLLAVALALGGCAATQPRYQWGKYDESLYQAYKEPSKTEALRLSLQAHVEALEAAGQVVAPGLYAELGTLHLQQGDEKKALQYYAKERDAWPESRGLMEAMMSNIERRMASAKETRQ